MGSDKGFVHLHLHTSYSLLDGAIKIPALMKRTADFGLPGVAMTDHGNLFGAVELVGEAKKFGLNGIVGCEAYLAPESRHDKKVIEGFEKAYHIVLLAMDEWGYKNLCKLISYANIEGFYYRPRIDKELLRKYNQGLIATSACLAGEIPNLIGKDRLDLAKEKLAEYLDIFDDGRFYLEIQKNGIPLQDKVNRQLVQWSKEYNIPLIATGDCHYLEKPDAKAHDVLLCIQTGANVTDTKRYRFDTEDLYYKTAEEMRADFAEYPEACDNTLEVAARCNFKFQTKHVFPKYEVPEGVSLDDEMERQAREGLEKRLVFMRENYEHWSDELEEEYQKRFDEEIAIIRSMQFAGYFLIVSDFIVWAKNQGIPVGPGRGSAAGSLVAFSMFITDIDPIRYNLLFERFLNPERVSMPDIDVDFCQDRRDEVIKYVTEKYGGEKNVTQIITFGQMKSKAVIRDVGRAMGIPLRDVDKLAKMVPPDLKMTIPKAMEQDSRFDEWGRQDPQVKQLLQYAVSLEGLARHAGIHAAGVVIADKPLDEYLPLYRHSKGDITTAFEMKSVEKIGLIKFDFLGLKTLSIIRYCLELVEKNYDVKVDLEKIDMKDRKTFELLQSGKTAAVFQLESPGMRDILRKMKPDVFEDIVAILALYRPGPIQGGMVDEFIQRKHGKLPVTYQVPELEPILKETYGVILYQEQVMQISRALAGYSLGQADLLRRAMGKKVAEQMAIERETFLEGAQKQGHDLKVAGEIFDLMAKFAEYGFNKSHSAAYALVSYHTAWLKAHYPKEFMAAVLSYEVNNTDKIVAYTTECRDMGIPILPPSANNSVLKFSTEENAIRFGLSGIKGLGDGAIDAILEARNDGPFKDLFELCERADGRKVNRKALESLVKSGALDLGPDGPQRSQIFAAIDGALEQSSRARKDAEAGQFNMFGALTEASPATGPTYPQVEPWTEAEMLKFEKEALGFYMSSHPLNKYRATLKRYATTNCQVIPERPTKSEVRLGVVVRSLREKITAKGSRMAFATFEDQTGSIDTVIFPNTYEKVAEILAAEDTPFFIIGDVERDEGDDVGADDMMAEARVQLILKDACRMDEVESRYADSVHVALQADELDEEMLFHLKNAFRRHPGPKRTVLHLVIPHRSETVVELPGEYGVTPNEHFIQEIKKLLGRDVVSLR